MKNVIFLTSCLLFFFALSSRAQNVQDSSSNAFSEIRFGAKGGIVLANLYGSDLIDNSPILGFQLGGAAMVPITEVISFAPELLLSFQGAKDDDESLKLNYLNIPLMGKYHITKEIAVEFGPQIGLLLWDNGDDFGADFNTFDFGLGIGGGYRLNDNIYLQVRFNHGFSKVLDNLKLYNGAFQMGAIYYF